VAKNRWKNILNDVSFVVRPQQMVLVLGVPGSGKTTLFKLLSNQLQFGEVRGTYLYNGHAPDSRKFHRLVSFVTQEDVHMPAFTVRQTFEFAARCQMPEGAPEHKIQERIEMVMELLKLSHRADTVVGDALLRGVSGGEKKRVTVGIEFMKGSGMYLMDEPTTGLDAKTALDIFQSVRIMADLGPPAIVALKQPSYELFQLFDVVMIMSQGSIAYMGPANKALRYFEKLGYRCPSAMNPVDFLSEVVEQPEAYSVNGDDEEDLQREAMARASAKQRPSAAIVADSDSDADDDGGSEFIIVASGSSTKSRHAPSASAASSASDASTTTTPKKYKPVAAIEDRPTSAAEFIEAYSSSKFADRQQDAVLSAMPKTITRLMPSPRNVAKDSPEYFAQYPQPLWYQCWLCTARAFAFVRHTPKNMVFRVLKSIFMATFIGTMFFDLTDQWGDNKPGQKDAFSLQGLMFNVIAFIGFASLAAMPQVIMERRVFYQQRANRYYSTFPYFLAGIMVELPVALAESIIYGSMVYWMAGLALSADRFIFFLLTNVCLSLAMNAYCRFCACASRNFAVANAAAPAGVALMALFAGYIIQAQSIPPWFIVFYWLSPFHYAYEAMTINQLAGEKFTCKSNEVLPPVGTPGFNNATVCPFPCGDDILVNKLGFPKDFDERWHMLGVLLAFFVVFQIGSYFALRFIRFKPLVNVEDIDEAGDDGEAGAADVDGAIKINAAAIRRGGASSPSASPSGAQVKKIDGSYLSFRNMCYTVKGSDKQDLPLLRNVTGYVRPGMLLALMGPSGAGKTTLLDVIAAKKSGGRIDGDLLFNGEPRDEFFHRFTGYVEQQDIHKQTATVIEALRFSAVTRLHCTGGAAQRRARQNSHAEHVLELLELDTIAGQQIAGLSAEERKRVTIGVELAADPSLLFLDEPTSGLDAIGALNVMRSVERAAASGRTIICTIHQPSAKIFSFFSHLLLLKRGGEVIYFGETGRKARTVLQYFDEIGFYCPPHRNPADFVLDVSMATHTDDEQPISLPGAWAEHEWARRADDEVAAGIAPEGHAAPRFSSRYAASFGVQLSQLFRRQWQGYLRTPGITIMKVVRQIVVGLLLGFLFFQLPHDQLGAQEIVGLIFFAVLFANLGALAAIPGFFEDRATYYRERDSGCYYSINYLLSIVLSELPLQILGAIAFSLSMYFLVGMNLAGNGLHFLVFLVNYLGAILASLGLAQLSAVISPSAEIANAIAALIISLFTLSAGFLLTKNLIPDYWIWLYYLSFVRYPLEALTVNEVDGQHYKCADNELVWVDVSPTEVKSFCPVEKGKFIVDFFDMDSSMANIDLVVVYVYWIGLILATWFCLQFVKNIKR
jgi:ATP-binding cassette, subfamily G (WHITE), member 2, PDR